MFDAYERDGAAIANLMNELKTNGGFALSQGVMDALRENLTVAAYARQKHRRDHA